MEKCHDSLWLNRTNLALVTHIASIIITRQFVGNIDPLAKILYYHTNGLVKFSQLKNIANSSFSFSMLMFPFVSITGDYLGPRKMAALTMFFFLLGILIISCYSSIFVIRIGLGLIATGFGACITSYYPLYLQFPNMTGLIVGILGGASDVSMIIPVAVSSGYEKYGIPVEKTGFGIAAICGMLLVLNLILIPKAGWGADPIEAQNIETPLLKMRGLEITSSDVRRRQSFEPNTPVRHRIGSPARSGKATLTEILKDRSYAYFLVWFLVHTLRIKKHFMPFYRNLFSESMNAEIAEKLTDIFSICASFGCISSIITGYCVDRFGSHLVVMAVTLIGFLFFSGLSFFPPDLQLIFSTVLFISQTGACFGLYSVLCSKHEAQKFFSSLQAIAYILFGLLCILFDHIWTAEVIISTFGSFRAGNIFFTVASTFIQVLMLFLIWNDTRSVPQHYFFSPAKLEYSMVFDEEEAWI